MIISVFTLDYKGNKKSKKCDEVNDKKKKNKIDLNDYSLVALSDSRLDLKRKGQKLTRYSP